MLRAVDNLTPADAVKVTEVPVSAVAAIVTASPVSTVLSAGTFAVAGEVALVAFVTPLTVTARGAAFAIEVKNVLNVSAAALTSAIFLNDFIFLLLFVFLLSLIRISFFVYWSGSSSDSTTYYTFHI